MGRALLLLLGLLLLAAAGPVAEAPPNDGTSPDPWIWSQIQAGKDVDFNQRCGTDGLDPHTSDDPRWAASCRSVDPAALRALLTRPGLADTAPHGVRLRGARIDGTLNLDDAHLAAAEFTLIDCSIAGDLILTEAHLDGSLDIDGTVITGRLNASTAHIEGAVVIKHKATVEEDVDFEFATLSEFVWLAGATLAGGMNAGGMEAGSLNMSDDEFDDDVSLPGAKIHRGLTIDSVKLRTGKQLNVGLAQVGSFLTIQNTKFDGEVTLAAAKVTGPLAMDGVTFASGKQMTAAGLQIGGFMAAVNVEFGGGLLLANANVHDTLSMIGVKLTNGGQLKAPGLRVGGDFLLQDGEFGGDVTLRGADIHGQLNLDNSKLAPAASLSLERLRVGQDLYLRNVRSPRPIDAIALDAGSLDLRGATLGGLDLSGAVVDGDMRLGGTYDNGDKSWTKWTSPGNAKPVVVLRNARVANLQDAENSWTGTELVLEGFTYTHLGGVGGLNRDDMRDRSVKSWRKWLDLDPVYSPQPYAELAAVLVASGNSDAATAIRFFGRDRERREMLQDCWPRSTPAAASTRPQHPCNRWGGVGLSVMQATIGYGIGAYTFRAVWWTLGLALVGTIILWFAPGVRGLADASRRGRRQKPLLWCFGASLSHVLPVVSLSPEFTDFFNDPKGERLYAWQQIAFAILALCGWALSFFVVAALSGLTQS